jgi:hypothetical protein
MPDRIDARPVLGLIGGALILISLFLDWYQAPASAWTMDAWTAFETLDLVLAGVAIATLYIAWEQFAGRDRIGSGWLLPLALLALVVVVSQILDPPPSALPPAALANPIAGPEADPATGAWLALGGAGALVVAGVLSMASVQLSLVLDSSGRSGNTTTRRRASTQDA